MSALSDSASTQVGFGSRGLRELLAEADPRSATAWRFWEDWISFALLAIAQFSVAFSIARANWVDEMPALPVAAAIGLVVGALLALLGPRPWTAFLGGVAVGVVAATAMVLHTMELSDPFATGLGITTRLGDLWGRMGDWLAALVTGGVSTDPLPFVLLLVFAVWLVPYLASWAVFRWRNPWLALLPGGFVLLTNISYLPGKPALEFVIFLFAAILLFTRIHLLRTVRGWRGQAIAMPRWLSLQVLHAGGWVAAGLILFAWIVPVGDGWEPAAGAWGNAIRPITDRIQPLGQVFIGIDGKHGQLIHQFEGALPLQGRVNLDDETMYVVSTETGGLAYLRAFVFDRYERGGWRLSDTELVEPPAITVEAARFGTPATRAQERRLVAVEVHVESPLSDRRLLTVGEPLATDVEAKFLTGASPSDVIGMRPSGRLGSGESYTAVGSVSVAGVDALVAADAEYPQWVLERYLQVPDSVPPRVGELAAQIVSPEDPPYLAAFRVERYLRENYPFSLRVSDPPPRRDPIDWFLFESREGYFDHHASAMVVLLRTLGIPARIAVGFALDETSFSESSEAFVLSEKDSWAWPEVFFPGYGWVEFNPAPVRELVSRSRPAGTFEVLPGAGVDDAIAALELAELLEESLEPAGIGGPREDLVDGGGSLWAPLGLIAGWTIAALAAVAALVLIVRGAWAFPDRGLSPATARWARLQRISGWAGIPAPANRTPLEAAAGLKRDLESEEPVEILADAFTRERYGAPDAAMTEEPEEEDPAVRRADALYRRLRNRLFREILLRRLWLRRLAR
ncbi:MAG: transglutaminase domain-containing protein [Chloroflexi bacterium]|nr:transglutaminase domain-containing protein [Chloroflexota bacterium]